MYSIYLIKNLIDDKVYVGYTSAEIPEHRWHQHLSELLGNRHRNSHLQNSFNKYSKENFEWFLIYNKEIETRKEAGEIEEFYRQWYNSIGLAYNIKTGGFGGSNGIMSNDTKNKIRVANLGKVLSKETKEKISRANIGKHTYWKGKSQPKEVVEKRIKSILGKKRTGEFKKNQRDIMLGKYLGGKLYTAFNETKSLAQWYLDPRCKATSVQCIKSRLVLGWDIETAISKPMRGKNVVY